jgi:hypothetical protein
VWLKKRDAIASLEENISSLPRCKLRPALAMLDRLRSAQITSGGQKFSPDQKTVLAVTAAAATEPTPVVEAIHGRVVGWAKSGSDWFALYVKRNGGGWCGLAVTRDIFGHKLEMASRSSTRRLYRLRRKECDLPSR